MTEFQMPEPKMTGRPIKIFLISLAGSIAVTVFLFFIMAMLIENAADTANKKPKNKLADIVMPEREIDTRYKQKKPPKPNVVNPLPKIEPLKFQPPQMDSEQVTVKAPPIFLNNAPTLGLNSGEGDYLPIVKVQPIYPRNALQRGIAGYVVVEFTVAQNGSVKNVVVIESEPSSIFDRAAIKAARKFKYKPRVIDGEAIEVAGVRNKISFQLESSDQRSN